MRVCHMTHPHFVLFIFSNSHLPFLTSHFSLLIAHRSLNLSANLCEVGFHAFGIAFFDNL